MQFRSELSDNSEMSNSLKQLVERRLSETQQNAFQAALDAKLEKTFIDDILRGRKKTIRGASVAKLAAALQVPAEQILSAMSTAEEPSELRPAEVSLPARTAMPRDVAVLGTAYGSVVQEDFDGFSFEGGTIEYVARPPGLIGAADIYAIYVQNDSMHPEHRSGGLRFVSSRRPVSIGDTVIVQTRHHDNDPGQAYIKHLKKRLPNKIVLEQLNPPATLEVEMRFVTAIHKVLDYNDLFGV